MSRGDNLIPGGQHPLRHGLAFSSAAAAFASTPVLKLLTVSGSHPFFARLFAISLAMVAGWLMHRTFTFAVTTPPSFAEFLRYAAGVARGGHQLRRVRRHPSAAPRDRAAGRARRLVAVAMVFAYLGMRFAAFRVGGGAQK